MEKRSLKWVLFSRIMQLISISLLLYGGFYLIKDLYSGVSSVYETLNFIITNPVKFIKEQDPGAGTAYLMIAGIVFYNIKKHQQFWYGFVEALFALVNCYIQFTRIQTDVSTGIINYTAGITTIGTIYLVVRGVNNIDDGYKKSFIGKFIIAYVVEDFKKDVVGIKEDYIEFRSELKNEFGRKSKNDAKID